MASADNIQAKVETALQPYFANARGEVLPKYQTIAGLTCMTGVGQELPAKIAGAIAADKEIMQELNMIQLAPLVGGANYRYFVLGFDNGMIRYEIPTRQFIVAPPPPGYAEHYRQVCGLDQ